MANNLNQYTYPEDSIDLREIFKILLEFKKILISTILIFTLASISYSLTLKPSFISSTKLEIGYIDMTNGDKELIESTSNLVSALKVLLLRNPDNKFSQKVPISLIEKKVINLETTSSSGEQNENILNEMISYIDERHLRLEKLKAKKNKDKTVFDIEITKAEVNYITAKLTNNYQSKYLDIISNLEKPDQAFETLNLLAKNSIYADQLFSLNQKLKTSIQNLENLDSIVYSKTQRIGNIETKTIKPKTLEIISLGLIFGFITGIFLALINNFIKKL
jgi:uncharacterized protein involved in exopolysaccharide biosynthesis